MANSDVLIVEVELPPSKGLLFQGLLQGEDGLAVVRCMDPQHKRQQLWTTPAQRQEIHAWLRALPADLEVNVIEERLWTGEGHGQG